MVDIAPFRGLLYDPEAVGDLSRVVAPPYDVISESERETLEGASPYNVVRLILPRKENDEPDGRYVQARALLDAWRAAGILREEPREAFYLYEQRFTLDGEAHVQRGLLAAVALDDPDAGGVLPHERTYDDIVDDRLALLRATATNLDTIFCVYSGLDRTAADRVDAATASTPLLSCRTDDAVEHALWRIDDPGDHEVIAKALSGVRVVIADGHHRHRTAQRYRDERTSAEGPGPWDRQLMFLVDVADRGPALLPIHRTVSGLEPAEARARLSGVFRLEPAPPEDPEALARDLADRRTSGEHVFALLERDRAWWLTVADPEAVEALLPSDRSPAWRGLDVAVLHTVIFDRLLGGVSPAFVHHAHEVAEAIEAGRADLGFLLAPPEFGAVLAVAEAGEAMPQKSTYFIPKPKTGIVFRGLDR